MSAPLMLSVSGCRGIVGESLTPELISKFAGAFGGFLVDRAAEARKKNQSVTVVVGRDGRPGGQMVRDAAVAGLTAAGCNVIDIGIAMTPTVGVMTDAIEGAAGGMVFTASHNPQEWNGMKCLVREPHAKFGKVSACAPPKLIADQIIERYKSGQVKLQPWSKVGMVGYLEAEAIETHCAMVDDVLKKLRVAKDIKKAKFSVVLDCVNGAGSTIAPQYLEHLGCKVELHGGESGEPFPHTPEPIAQNLGSLCRAVKKRKAAIGFAQDPDADRLALVDEKGRFIGEEYTLVLAAKALFELGGGGKKPRCAVNMSTSRMIEDLCEAHEAMCFRSAVGEANVVEVMKREGCIIGGEGNGGVILPAVTYIRDSLSAMGLVLGLMAATKLSLSQLVDELPQYSIEKRKVELLRKEDANPAAEKIAAKYSDAHVNRADGVRVDWAHHTSGGAAWLHVRASNTEPIMRLIAEAPTPAAAKAVLDEAAAVIAR